MVELENGHSIICSALQTRYELLSLEGNTSDYLDNSHFYLNELPRQNDIKSMKLALADLNEVILNEFSDLSQKERAETLETINTMRLNLKAHFELTQSLYKTDIFKYEFTNWFDKNNVEFIEEVSSLIEDFSINISLLNAKRKVFSFFSDSHDFYTLSYRIANYGYLDFDELSYILEDIEAYVFSVYDYIELAYKIANKTNSPASIDYHKIYSIMRNFFSGFISIAKLPYNFEFDLPKNSVKENEIKEIHLKATHILFQIKQTFQNKYHLK